MNILIVGSGGREHALAWKLSQSKKVNKVFIAPGNAGTADAGINLQIDPDDFTSLKRAVKEHNIGMVVVGPEAPLVKGIHDFFLADEDLSGIPVIGPEKEAAMLEGSKDFAKSFMMRHGIPTAAYRTFTSYNEKEIAGFLSTFNPPYVVKADGLAAGKGVLILDSPLEALKETEAILAGKFGEAGNRVVIEQFLRGIELSVFVITDGKSYALLPEAKDYKRIGIGDTGLNTGGMGAVSPVLFADDVFMKKVKERIIDPTVNGLTMDGIRYKGFIFFGLINCNGDPFVIEYNARLGDPETEVIIPRISSDLYDLLEGVAYGNLSEKSIIIDEKYYTTVMLVSGGYPGSYDKGKEILFKGEAENAVVFHAGTGISEGKVITSGGRVISVTGWGNSMTEALDKSYSAAGLIEFDKMYFRTDIGLDLLD